MPHSIGTTMGPREWLMLLALSLLWGGSFFFVELVVEQVSPLTIVSLRVGLAALTLWGVAALVGAPFPTDPVVWLGSGSHCIGPRLHTQRNHAVVHSHRRRIAAAR